MKKLIMLVAVTMAAMMAFSAAPTRGLVAYYPFDGDAKDKSGNHNDGIMIGTRPTADRKGRRGSAMLFGEGNYITVPSSPSLNSPKDQITIAAWVRIGEWVNHNRWGNLFCILSKGVNASTMAYRFEFFEKLRQVNTGGLSSDNISSVSCGNLRGEWHHVAMVSDGKVVKLYIDGGIVGATTATGRPDRPGNSGALSIGANLPDYPDECFLGAMDELRIYNRALSDDEINAVYNADPPTKTSAMEIKGWHVTTYDRTVRSIGDAEATVQNNMSMIAQGDYPVLAFTNFAALYYPLYYPEYHAAFPEFGKEK